MKKFFFFTILSLASFGGISAAFAQIAPASQPQIFLTWRANTYVPPGFEGKTMPSPNSQIIASAELIDGGKIIDVSKQNVYWYLDNDFLAGGAGTQSVVFRAPDGSGGGSVPLRVEFPNYAKGSQLKTVNIPIAAPEAIIESPFPDGKFSSSPFQLTGQPYFFNVDSISRLNFNWSVNGQTPSGAENPQALNVKFGMMPAGTSLLVSLSIKNAANQYEYASENSTYFYSP